MKSYLKLTIAVIAILAVIFTGANIILHYENKGDAGRPYRVEAERIAAKIENGEEYFLDDYRYIKNIEIQAATATILSRRSAESSTALIIPTKPTIPRR